MQWELQSWNLQLDRNSDGQIDVRDLLIQMEGLFAINARAAITRRVVSRPHHL